MCCFGCACTGENDVEQVEEDFLWGARALGFLIHQNSLKDILKYHNQYLVIFPQRCHLGINEAQYHLHCININLAENITATLPLSVAFSHGDPISSGFVLLLPLTSPLPFPSLNKASPSSYIIAKSLRKLRCFCDNSRSFAIRFTIAVSILLTLTTRRFRFRSSPPTTFNFKLRRFCLLKIAFPFSSHSALSFNLSFFFFFFLRA